MRLRAVPEVVYKTIRGTEMAHSPKSHGTAPRPLTEVQYVKPKAKRLAESAQQCICSTLYNPVIDDIQDTDFLEGVEQLAFEYDLQIEHVLPDDFTKEGIIITTLAAVLTGSKPGYQLQKPESDGNILRIPDEKRY